MDQRYYTPPRPRSGQQLLVNAQGAQGEIQRHLTPPHAIIPITFANHTQSVADADFNNDQNRAIYDDLMHEILAMPAAAAGLGGLQAECKEDFPALQGDFNGGNQRPLKGATAMLLAKCAVLLSGTAGDILATNLAMNLTGIPEGTFVRLKSNILTNVIETGEHRRLSQGGHHAHNM